MEKHGRELSDERRMKKKICMACGCSNAIKAKRCRKCHSTKLRMKSKGKGAK